jgi:[FeFe] hydrogenase (group B1/B3)
MTITNNARLIRRDILARLSKILLKDYDLSEADRIAFDMRPRGGSHVRCCVYRDRAVIRYKIMNMLGFDSNHEEDELTGLGSYLQRYLDGETQSSAILNVDDEACSSCQKSNYVVTNMCRGCVGRPCMLNCPKDAITFDGNRARIDADSCVNCGLCQKVCPFHAIIYSPVPCEEACPVRAIQKDEQGKEKIDTEKCTLCGKCLDACPFGAIVEKTDLFKVIDAIRKDQQVIAMVAPSIAGQFRESMEQITGSLVELGFSSVYEVAMGADVTSRKEAAEFKEKAAAGEPMTTSCCPAYVNLVRKHAPELLHYVSSTLSPMEYTARMLRKQYPDSRLVFIGPCVGKKGEAEKSHNVDYVLNFEEFGSWLIADGIEISKCQVSQLDGSVTNQSRLYARAGGVSEAVAWKIPELTVKTACFDGIDKKFPRKLRSALKDNHPRLIEVMACEGGCVGGCYSIVSPKAANRKLEKFADQQSLNVNE